MTIYHCRVPRLICDYGAEVKEKREQYQAVISSLEQAEVRLQALRKDTEDLLTCFEDTNKELRQQLQVHSQIAERLWPLAVNDCVASRYPYALSCH